MQNALLTIKNDRRNMLNKKISDGKSDLGKVGQFVKHLDFRLVIKSQDEIERDFKALGQACAVTDDIMAAIPPTIAEIDHALAVFNKELNSNAAELVAVEQKLADSKAKTTGLDQRVGQSITPEMIQSSIKTMNDAKDAFDRNIKTLTALKQDYLRLLPLALSSKEIRARLTEFKAKTSAPSDNALYMYIMDLVKKFNQYLLYNDNVEKMGRFSFALDEALKSKEDTDSKADHAGLEKTYNDLTKDRKGLIEIYPKLKTDYDVLVKNIDVELQLLQQVVISLGNSTVEGQTKMVAQAKEVIKNHQEIKEKFGNFVECIRAITTTNFQPALEKLKAKASTAALAASLSKVTGGAQQATGAAAVPSTVSANPNLNQAQFKPT